MAARFQRQTAPQNLILYSKLPNAIAESDSPNTRSVLSIICQEAWDSVSP